MMWRASFPTRERGLKLPILFNAALNNLSFPTRERGLKHCSHTRNKPGLYVVPYAGTWIETFKISSVFLLS